ncbi:MAG: ribosome biogenesis GTPase YlqF [Mycoplasmatales bacterium]
MAVNNKTIQWYPGHMFKAKKEIIAQLKVIDVVVEVIDARVPFSSHNEMLDELTVNKTKLLVFSKADYVDTNKLKKYVKDYEEKGYDCIVANINTQNDRDRVLKKINNQGSVIKEKFAKKGINKTIRVLVMGMPNVGKSTLINFLAQKKKLIVGNKPGVTKQQHWIGVGDHLELLDTPGILVPKIEDLHQGYNLVLCSLIKDEVVHMDDVAIYLLEYLYDQYPNVLMSRYKMNELGEFDIEQLYNKIAKTCGALLPGNEYDYDRVTKILINDFRSQKFGKIILD